MSYLITLGLVESISDPIVDRIKMVLARATNIKRDRDVNELSNELVVYDGVCAGNGANAGAGAGQHEGATSCISGFLFEKCKKHDKDSIMYLQTLSQDVNELKNKRSVMEYKKNVRHPYTPQDKRRKEPFVKAIQNLKKKMFGETRRAVMEEVKEYKTLNIYKRVNVAEKTKVFSVTSSRDIRIEYSMHVFTEQDFWNMTSTIVWWEDWVSLHFIMHVSFIFSIDYSSLKFNIIFYFSVLTKSLTSCVRGM